MNSEHTKGRLRQGGKGRDLLMESDKGTVAGVIREMGEYVEGTIGYGESRANARRLVACWNTCEGISTEDLEGVQPGETAQLTMNIVSATLDARQERDELIEALREIADLYEKARIDGGATTVSITINNARALLARHAPKVPG